jgi:cytochrome c-type biogenesis protein CcmH/NrfG
MRQKKMDEAIDALKRATALDPQNPVYAADLATAYRASRPQVPTSTPSDE